MATNTSSRSVRARRQEHQARKQRQRFLTIALVIAAVIIAAGGIFWVRQITSPTKNITLPASLDPPQNADGRAWGPVDAPILVEEFSDFQ